MSKVTVSFFWAHMREKQHVADGRRVGEQHNQAIDADTLSRRWRHTVLQCPNVVLVEVHGLFVARLLLLHLPAEAFGLIFGVVKLGKTIGNLAPTDEKLETIDC